MTIWQIRHHLTKNHGHHPCKYGHFGKLSDRATLSARHSPATLPSLSAAQGCRATLSGDTSDPFRCPRVPRDTLR
ncbi:MAG: hypothetical protein UDN37_00120 [Bacteroidales bacterium]|nr:hypothetical protein [Bacteroidales bacterium]